MKKINLIIALLLFVATIYGQKVNIDGDAMISGKVEVMDTILFADGTELASACMKLLQDADEDTKITVEESVDEDIIRFFANGVEVATLHENRFEIKAAGHSTFLGVNAGANDNGAENYCVYVGHHAGIVSTTGQYNTYLGSFAGGTNGSGSQNVAVGTSAGFANTGSDNVLIGRNAGRQTFEGSQNTYIGLDVAFNNTGSGNVFIGHQVGMNTDFSNRLLIGNQFNSQLIYGEFDNNLLRIGGTLNINNAYSFPLGPGSAGQVLINNGSGSLYWGNAGSSGSASSLVDADGDTKVQVEESADEDLIRFDIAGEEKMLLQEKRLSLKQGIGNVHIGQGSVGNTSTGTDNTILGAYAGGNLTSGTDNVYVGSEAGSDHNGSQNTFIGRAAGFNNSGSGNVFIGHNAGYSTSGSDKLVIDNMDNPNPLLYGSFSSNKMAINGTDLLGSANLTVHDLDGSWGGMYLNADRPFYGYAINNNVKAYHYMEGDEWRFHKGGTILVLDEDNNMGIGETSPDARLHVKASSTSHVMKIENSSTSSSADGLEIKINRNVVGEDNNFITFNDANSVAGRIEGFSTTDPNFVNFPGVDLSAYFDLIEFENLVFDPGSIGSICVDEPPNLPSSLNSGSFEIEFASFAVCIASGGLNQSACNNAFSSFTPPSFDVPIEDWSLGSYEPCGWDLPELDVDILIDPEIRTTAFADLQAITNWAVINGVEVMSFLSPWVNQWAQDPEYWNNVALAKNGGVTYGSKGADYAEWLEREDLSETIKPGQIVGVKKGKISLDTEDAEQLMVISMMPVVLGNLPDSSRIQDFEKVAFLGQSPVWVVGDVKSGDYIIPSGNKDGFGLAISPEDLTIEQLSQVVGRAWQDSDQIVNLVNMVVGIKTNEMAEVLSRTSKKVDKMEDRLAKVEAALGITDVAEK